MPTSLAGGAGDDTYITDGRIRFPRAPMRDLIRCTAPRPSRSPTILRNLTLTGAGNVNGTGNGANNVITGNDGHNRLLGGARLDTLAGGKGEDVRLGGGKDIMARGDDNDPSSSMPSTTPASAPPTGISSPTSRAAV